MMSLSDYIKLRIKELYQSYLPGAYSHDEQKNLTTGQIMHRSEIDGAIKELRRLDEWNDEKVGRL